MLLRLAVARGDMQPVIDPGFGQDGGTPCVTQPLHLLDIMFVAKHFVS